LALGVILATGFDEPLKEWQRSSKVQVGQDVNLQDAVAGVASLLIPWALLPPWAFKLPIEEWVIVREYLPSLTGLRVKRIGFIFNKFESLMKNKIASRRSDVVAKSFHTEGDKPRDLFTRLLEANVGDGSLSLNDQELLGNSFGFLFAGHGK
jgi:hypothetical protein